MKIADPDAVAKLAAQHRSLTRLAAEPIIQVAVLPGPHADQGDDPYVSLELDELARPLVRSHIVKRLNAIEAQLRQLGVSV